MRKVDPAKNATKRAEILQAAGRCFRRNGLKGSSIAELCAEAGISPGHLYHYFESKDAIVAELARARLESAKDDLEAVLQSDRSIIDILIGEMMTQAHGDRSTSAAMLFDVLAESARNPGMADLVQTYHAAMAKVLSEVLREGQAKGEIDPSLDPQTAASLMVGLIDAAKSLGLRDPAAGQSEIMLLFDRLIRSFLIPSGQVAATAGSSGADRRQGERPSRAGRAPRQQ